MRSSGLTSELTDRRALTYQSSKTPRHQSHAQTAVRCSDLVRQSKVHHSKLSGQHRPSRWPANPRRSEMYPPNTQGTRKKSARIREMNSGKSTQKEPKETKTQTRRRPDAAPDPLRSLSFLLCKTSEHCRLCPPNDQAQTPPPNQKEPLPCTQTMR